MATANLLSIQLGSESSGGGVARAGIYTERGIVGFAYVRCCILGDQFRENLSIIFDWKKHIKRMRERLPQRNHDPVTKCRVKIEIPAGSVKHDHTWADLGVFKK